MFVAHRHFHPSLIFAVKAELTQVALMLLHSKVGSQLCPKRVKVTIIFKNGRGKFYCSGPRQRKMADSYWSLIKGECLFAKWSDANRIIWKIKKE